jgi:hypothetical protein
VFSGEKYIEVIATGGPSLGFVERMGFRGPFGAIQDALGDVFIGQMLYLGGVAIAGFGYGTGFVLHFPFLGTDAGWNSFERWNDAIDKGMFGAFEAGGDRFEAAGNALVRSMPRQVRHTVFSGE